MSLRLIAAATALTLAVLLGGCGPAKVLLPPNLRPPSENSADALKLARLQLMQATPCCSSFADFSYRTMLPWQPQKFVLGNESMVANLNGTQSYFMAFRLPADVKLPYQIAVKAELNGRWLRSAYLFAPTIVLLDGGFQSIQSTDIGLCEHMGWSDDTTGAFGSMTIDNPRARYLLVYSSAEQQSGATYWEQSPASIKTSSAASLRMTSTGSFSIPHGPDGALWIGLMNTPYQKALDNGVCKKAESGEGVLNTLRTSLPLPWTTVNDGKPADGRHP